MQAVFKSGGQQFTVSPGDEVLLDLLSGETGAEVRFDEVLLTSTDDGTRVGRPCVEGAVIVGKVLAEVKGPKIRAVSFRRRKDSQTVKGHRQRYHRVKITAIEGV